MDVGRWLIMEIRHYSLEQRERATCLYCACQTDVLALLLRVSPRSLANSSRSRLRRFMRCRTVHLRNLPYYHLNLVQTKAAQPHERIKQVFLTRALLASGVALVCLCGCTSSTNGSSAARSLVNVGRKAQSFS